MIENEVDFSARKRGITEIIDIKTTAKTILLKKDFVYVQRMLPGLLWTAGSWTWSQFLGGGALSEGINIVYDGEPLFDENIIDNFGLKKFWFDGVPQIDTVATKRIVYPGRLSFNRFFPDGYYLNRDHKLGFLIGEDLSAAGGTDSVIQFIFEGWGYHE